MELALMLMRKKSWCDANCEDQRRLGNEANAAFWHGRSLSYQDVLDAVRSGVVMPDGTIAPLEHTWTTTRPQEARDAE